MTILRLLAALGLPYALYVAIPSLAPGGMPPWVVQAARFCAVAAALVVFGRHYRALPWGIPRGGGGDDGDGAASAECAGHAAKKRRAVFLVVAVSVAALALWILPYAAILAAKAGGEAAGDIIARANAATPPYPSGTAYALLRLANSVLLAPLAEELLFRGHIQPWLRHSALRDGGKSSGGAVGAALAALDDVASESFFRPAFGLRCEIPAAILFALGHAPAEYPSALLYYAATAWLYRKTRSLGACVAVHVVANAAVGVLAMNGLHFLW